MKKMVLKSAYSELANVYDRLMQDVPYDAWADYLLERMRAALPDGLSRVAECGCGTGEITLRLLKQGLDVTGLDRSPDMLRVAADKLRKAGYRHAPLVCADMRTLSLHRPADAVIAACDGVNYLTDDADASAFFSAAYRALRPGGLLLFDVSSAYKLRQVLDGHTFGEDLEDCAYLWQNIYDEESRLLQMDLSIFVREPDGRYAKSEETHQQRAYEEAELRRLLDMAGFCGIESYDAFTVHAPHATSERIQFIARRANNG